MNGDHVHITYAARKIAAAMPAGLRRSAVLPAACLVLTATGLVAPAAAAVSPNLVHTACNGNVCFESTSNGGFQAWAQSYPFYGHFQLQTPEHTSLNTTDRQMAVNTRYQIHASVVNGNYCITAWQLNGDNGYNKLGYTCMSVTW